MPLLTEQQPAMLLINRGYYLVKHLRKVQEPQRHIFNYSRRALQDGERCSENRKFRDHFADVVLNHTRHVQTETILVLSNPLLYAGKDPW